MTRVPRIAVLALGAAGLALYLWPALAAPVLVYSDGKLDIEWARSGAGIWKPVEETLHPAKPGYLLFLRAAMGAAPRADPARAIVVAQSLVLWISIAATSLVAGRRRGWRFGVVLYLLLLLFLRLRDSASAVMSEAISAALFLPLAALLVFPAKRRVATFVGAGLAAAALFWIRPNVGAIALLLAFLALRPARALPWVVLGFFALAIPAWLLTRSASSGGALRGLAHPVYAATAEYYWLPSLGTWPEGTARQRESEEFRRAAANWKELLSRGGPDARREIVWRALAGFFGTELYDARWSPVYRRITTASRLAAPFLILASIGLLLARPFSDPNRAWNLAAPAFLLLLLAQNLVLGSHPRYVLPFLPGIFLLGMVAASESRARHRLAALAAAALLALVLRADRGVLGWEWGRVEAAGVEIRQTIPKGALPASEPATLHVRIATGVLPTQTAVQVFDGGSGPLVARRRTASSPVVTVALPGDLLARNREREVEIVLRSAGDYDPFHFQLFPVVPPPWGAPARRTGSPELSPSTGVSAGSLDWWVHAGADPPAAGGS